MDLLMETMPMVRVMLLALGRLDALVVMQMLPRTLVPEIADRMGRV